MSKTIFVISQYIRPTDIPGGKNRYLLFRELARMGLDIYIFSSNFIHMTKSYLKEFDGLYFLEEVEGVKFVWVNTFAYQKSDWRRGINVADFGIKSYKAALDLANKGIRPDIIIGSVAHMFSVGAAYYTSKRLHARFFIEVGDLWPEVFIESGRMTQRNPIYILVKKVMYYYFGKAEKIICITEAAKNYFDNIGYGDKTIVLPFGVEITDSILANTKPPENEEFNVIYAGSFQPIYPLENVIKSAKVVEDSGCENIKFTLIGNGAQKEGLIKMASDLGLRSVDFVDAVPKNELPGLLQNASAFLIIEKHGRYGFPNKIIDYLSVGKPIVYISPARHEVLYSGCCIEAQNDPESIARAVMEMASLPNDKLDEMQRSAKNFLLNNHNIETTAKKLMKYI